MTIDFVRKLFRIRQGEAGKVIQFTIVASLLQAGISIGVSTADSLFLTNVGAIKLPNIYIILPFIMLAYIPISNFFLLKFGSEGLLKKCLLFLVIGGITLSVGINFLQQQQTGHPKILYYSYYFIKLFAELWAVAFFTLLWNFIDVYFDIQDAKRLFAFFSGGMALGAMVGGSLVAGMVSFFPVSYLFIAWSAICLSTVPLVNRLINKWPRLEEEDYDQDKSQKKSGFMSTIGSLFHSPYAIALTLTILATLMLTTICEYQCMDIFEEGRQAAEIARLFGKLIFSVSVLNLLINFFLFNRLVLIFGVRNVTIIQPFVYVFTYSFFLLQYGFGAAVFGYFAYQGILISIEYNNQNFLFNALPAKTKAALRTLIEGLCEPFATALVGLFLIAFSKMLLPETLSLIGLTGSVAVFCLVMWLRSEYGKAMVQNLKSTWMDFSVSVRSLFHISVEDGSILKQIAFSKDREKAVSAIQMYWLFNQTDALEALLQYLAECSGKEQAAIAPILATVLKEGNAQIIQRILLWLRSTKRNLTSVIKQELIRWNIINVEDIPSITSADTAEDKATASVALWNSWKLDANLEGVNIMNYLMNGDHEERIAAIRSIGKLERPRYIRLLSEFLQDSSAAVRKQTLLALYDLLDENSEEMLEEFIQVVRRRDHTDRIIALEALERMKNSDSIRPLITNSHRFTPFEKRKTEQLIGKIGLKSIPILVILLQDPSIHYEGRSLAARILSKLAFPQLEAVAPNLIHTEIRHAYWFLCAQITLAEDRENEISSLICKEMSDKIVQFVLELQTLSGQLPDFELMASSLRSNNPKDRANAIETIEQACTRQVSHSLLPLLDNRPVGDKVDFYQYQIGEKIPSRFELLQEMIKSPYQLTSALAVTLAFEKELGQPADSEIRNTIQQRLLSSSSSIVSSVLLSLLRRKYLSEQSDENKLNMIEKATCLIKSNFLNRFPILELEDVIHSAKEIYVKDNQYVYQKDSNSESIYLILNGTVQLVSDDDSVSYTDYQTFGTEILYGKDMNKSNAKSGGANLLCLSKRVILDTAEIHPVFAIELLAKKILSRGKAWQGKPAY